VSRDAAWRIGGTPSPLPVAGMGTMLGCAAPGT